MQEHYLLMPPLDVDLWDNMQGNSMQANPFFAEGNFYRNLNTRENTCIASFWNNKEARGSLNFAKLCKLLVVGWKGIPIQKWPKQIIHNFWSFGGGMVENRKCFAYEFFSFEAPFDLLWSFYKCAHSSHKKLFKWKGTMGQWRGTIVLEWLANGNNRSTYAPC